MSSSDPVEFLRVPYRIGIVGMGHHALQFTKHIFQYPERWELVAVVDPSAAAFARFQSKFHTKRTACYKTIQDAEPLAMADLILVTTTAPYHCPVALELI